MHRDQAGDDAAQPPVLPGEQPLRVADLPVGPERHPPQRLPAERGQVERAVAAVGQARRGGLGGGPGQHGVDELRCAAGALHLGPAVVAAGLDQVELVERVLPELAGPQPVLSVPGEALHVAVAHRVDRRRRGRVVRRGRAVARIDPQDLAGQGPGVLGERAVGGVAGADVEVAVRAELDPPTVVVAGPRDAGDQLGHDRLTALRAGPQVEPHHPVVLRRGQVGEQRLPSTARRHRQPEQPALPAGPHPRDRHQRRRVLPRRHTPYGGGVPFPDQGGAVLQQHQAPGHVEAGGQHGRARTTRGLRVGGAARRGIRGAGRQGERQRRHDEVCRRAAGRGHRGTPSWVGSLRLA